LLPSDSHNEFLELCALATAGGLDEEERQRLQQHLAQCASCRQAMREYDATAGVAAAAAGPASLALDLNPDPSWSPEQAESSFFNRLGQGTSEDEAGEQGTSSRRPGYPPLDTKSTQFPVPAGDDHIWRHVWLQYAATILLVAALGVCVYQIGIRGGMQVASTAGTSATPTPSPMEQQLSDAGHERAVLQNESAQREKLISDLRSQLADQSAEIARMKEAQARLEGDLHKEAANKGRLAQEQAQMAQQVAAAQVRAGELQDKLDSLARKSSADATQVAGLEAKINELTKTLRDRQDTVDQQQELLAHDRDIRELMGARDLYIAEVYDVARSGATQKPYGRVFYTKGKSLIFYAYDLDQQSGIKNARATFQAWGRRGADWQQALNLGLFYEDSVAKKRWILRFNDPKALAQIDAVFVTVEPNGGSRRPSSKPFLFAYLRIEPNHP
jgi:Putative zinc-finger